MSRQCYSIVVGLLIVSQVIVYIVITATRGTPHIGTNSPSLTNYSETIQTPSKDMIAGTEYLIQESESALQIGPEQAVSDGLSEVTLESNSKKTVLSSLGEDSGLNSPNIVFIMADDMGYGDVHYNGGKADTPNLDAMVAGPNSIQFTRFYSGGPVCSPTRGTVLTGRNHNRYCIWRANTGHDCPDFRCSERLPLPAYEITVAEVLKEHGYRTAIFGKWHLGNLKLVKHLKEGWTVSHPGMHGFDKWWVTERSVTTANSNCACFDVSQCELGHYKGPPPCTNYHTMAESGKGPLKAYPKPIKGDDSYFLLEHFRKFLDTTVESGQPFFIYLPFHTPHIRYVATPEYRQRYLSRRRSTTNQADYYGAITAMDEVVGHVRELLRKYNVSDNTMVWFTSDNGPQVHTPGETAGLRGFKASLFEGGIRVPGIIEWPSVIKANQRSDTPVVTSDFFPTVCDILGVDPPKDRSIDGMSILPLIRGEISSRNQSIAWAYKIADGDFYGSYSAAITNDQYKLYANYNGGKVLKAQLFDLLNDSGEVRDISGQYPDITKSMEIELEEWRQSVMNSARTEVKCLK